MKTSTILVIEDEESIRDIICEILSAEDYEVILAEDGHIGVILAQEKLPDLVVCDIMMPEFDGYSVVTQLHQNPNTRSIPFIFLTARAAATDIEFGIDLGANDYLTKPFTKDALLQSVVTQLASTTATCSQADRGQTQLFELLETLPNELHQSLQRLTHLTDSLLAHCQNVSQDGMQVPLTEIRITSEQVYRIAQNTLLHQVLAHVDSASIRTDSAQPLTLTQPLISQVVHQYALQQGRCSDLLLTLEGGTVPVHEAVVKKVAMEVMVHACEVSAPGTPIHAWSTQHECRFSLYVRYHKATSNQPMTDGINESPDQGKAVMPLGLQVVAKLLRLYGGRLQVEQGSMQGTTLHLQLPAA